MNAKHEPHLVKVQATDDTQDEAIGDLRDRIEKLERWQAFVLGVVAAVGALVGAGLAVAGLVIK